ncbi:MAG: hypothetical protein ACKV2O_01915 [Acidimicrobiales bacterium]
MSDENEIDVTGRAVWLGPAADPAHPVYVGPDAFIEVAVNGDRKGEVTTHHIVLVNGAAPVFAAGPAPAPPLSQLELSGKDARAQQEGRLVPVVGYMRGTTKTKGATRPLYEFFRTLDRRARPS